MSLYLLLTNGSTAAAFEAALLASFGSYFALKELVELHLEGFTGVPLTHVASRSLSQVEVVDALLESATARGYGLELLLGSLAERPRNPRLLAFVKEVVLRGGLADDGFEPDTARAEARLKISRKLLGLTSDPSVRLLLRLLLLLDTELSRDPQMGAQLVPPEFASFPAWRERLLQIERRVCRVGCENGTAAGLLVGPDLVLTSSEVANGQAELYFTVAHEQGSQAEEFCRLRDTGWLAAGSLGTAGDYALLRTEGAPGAKRGWEDLSNHAVTVAEEPLFMIRHQGVQPMRLAAGTVDRVGDAALQLTFPDDTSGAPCFDLTWRPAALYLADPTVRGRGLRMDRLYSELAPYLANS